MEYPATCSCKNGKYFANIMDDSVIMCDEITESYGKETKSVPWKFNEKNTKFLYFTWIFIKCYNIIDNCYYLLLPDKISSKTNKCYHFTSEITN